MQITIRKMKKDDEKSVLDMMRGFYASPAVFTNGSEAVFKADFNACVTENPYLEGYVFEAQGEIAGYGMAAKSFSTEFGKKCVWIEDLFVKEAFRGKGIGSEFLRRIEEQYPDALLRLEVEAENERAVRVYRKSGFEELPYLEMKKGS